MSEFDQRRAFLDEVLARPDDDAPRLIYADYLEELGDPRGEFIRLQCELARLDELDPRYLDIAHRCDDLLVQHRDQWAAELKQDVRKIAFTRGFIDNITIRARAFIKEADALFQSTPVHWLRLVYIRGAGAALADSQSLSKIRFLDLSSLSIPEADLTALLTSPHLSNLRALNLAHLDSELSEAAGKAVAQMPAATRLHDLDLPGGGKFLGALSQGDGFTNLEHFAIGSAYFDNDLAGLANLRIPRLTSLKLRGVLTVAGCQAATALPLSQLKSLDLESTRIPGRGLKLLAERGALDHVEQLNLAGCDLRVRAAKALFQGQRLGQCISLDLSRNPSLGDDDGRDKFVTALSGHEPLGRLQRLQLGGLNAAQVRQVTKMPQLRGLQSLALTSSQLGADALHGLIESPFSESLRHLRLSGCSMAVDTMERSRNARPFPNLLRLELGGGYDDPATFNSRITIQLLKSPIFSGVQAIYLDHMSVPADTLAQIANVDLPELRVISYAYSRASAKAIDRLMNSPRLPKLAKLILTGTTGMGRRQKLIDQYGERIRL